MDDIGTLVAAWKAQVAALRPGRPGPMPEPCRPCLAAGVRNDYVGVAETCTHLGRENPELRTP